MEGKSSTQQGKFYAIVEFEDGIQIVPNNWLSIDLKKAAWPNFTNNKRYDKAVKVMEEPQSTWLKHPISKIYVTYSNYTLARKKLKDAEKLSDLTSNTDRDEFLKKSRKIRAAKSVDEDNTSNDEQSDTSLILDLPKVPEKHAIMKTKNGKVSQTGEQSDDENLLNKVVETQASMPSQQTKNTMSNLNTKSAHYMCSHTEQSSTTDLDSINEFNETQDTSISIRQRCQSVQTMSSNLDNKPERDNFQWFVIGKLIDLELKINSNGRLLKLIAEKLPITNIREERKEESIDIFQDLPLKNQNDVQAMETKIMNDKVYQSQMVKQLVRVTCKDLKTSCIQLMRKIFSNNVAVNYSWYGAKKKENFSQLQICKIIMCK
ncbi:uncharacterized protein [Linepithema humile]|uniref:uncharacterized protein isoform X2 n=1 Tax=Linepithema humile TaxID=83485 RepID=UPI00351EA403